MTLTPIEETRLMIKGQISELDKSQQEKVSEIKLYLHEKYSKNAVEFILALALFQIENGL
ncbi:hypothetical protein [Gilliamella apicola]|uniref:hypothetical protein n=1 Tax=Gilliamella apicola TaxID=1196095 RepID=UPI003986BEDF